MRKWYSPIFMALVIWAVAGNTAQASPDAAPTDISIQQINAAFVAAAAKATPAVVTITAERVAKRSMPSNHPFRDFFGEDFFPERESRRTALGSGVIIDAQKGYIVTNNHVVEDAEEIYVVLDDRREVPAKVVGTDPFTDLAVIRIQANGLQTVENGDSDILRVGEWVLAIGSPFSAELEHTVTAGIVSAKGRSRVFAGNRLEDYIQIDAAINPGNSGGALVNLDGELVGINAAIATDGFSRSNAGVGFAIPVNLVKRVAADLIADGHVSRAYLGVRIDDVKASTARAMGLKRPEGAIVGRVEKDTPASKAGLEVGDIILKVDASGIKDASHLTKVITTFRPGERHKVTVLRDGKEKTFSVKLTERPSDFAGAKESSRDRETDAVDRTGFAVADLSSQAARQYEELEADHGVIITRVDRSSKAYREGVRVGMVLVRMGDQEIKDVGDYRKILKTYEKGDTVLLRLLAGNVYVFVGLEVG